MSASGTQMRKPTDIVRLLASRCVPHPAVCPHCFEPAEAGGCLPIGFALSDSPSGDRLPIHRYWLKTLSEASRA